MRARIPFPAWRNISWEPPRDMRRQLSSFQETFILSVYPPGTRILSARFHRSVRLPCPIWVRVVLPQGEEQMLILQNKKRESPADFIPGMKRFLQHTTRLFRSLVMGLTQFYGCVILLNRKNVLYGGSMRQKTTPSFILSLPLQVNAQQAARLHAHFECARQLYNALLAEAMKRLTRMKADPTWQAACSIPRSDKPARRQAFARLRTQYGFSEYGLHEAAKHLRTSWPASHIDSLMAQKLASRAYQAANRVCVGEAWTRSRARPTPRGCASSCKPERKATRAGSVGTASRSQP